MFKRLHTHTGNDTRGLRDSAVLPSIKCSTCGHEVHLRLMPMHRCPGQPKPPRLNGTYKTRGLDDYDEQPSPVGNFPSMPLATNAGGKKLHNILEPTADILGEDFVDDYDDDNSEQENDASSADTTLSPEHFAPSAKVPHGDRTDTSNTSTSNNTYSGTNSFDSFTTQNTSAGLTEKVRPKPYYQHS